MKEDAAPNLLYFHTFFETVDERVEGQHLKKVGALNFGVADLKSIETLYKNGVNAAIKAFQSSELNDGLGGRLGVFRGPAT